MAAGWERCGGRSRKLGGWDLASHRDWRQWWRTWQSVGVQDFCVAFLPIVRLRLTFLVVLQV